MNVAASVTALDGSVLDLSVLLLIYVSIGDCVFFHEYKAIDLGLLSPDGVLDLDLVYEKCLKIDNFLLCDQDTAANLGIVQTEALVDFSFCSPLLVIIMDRAGIAKDTDIYAQVLNSNGDSLEISLFKDIDTFEI